MPCDLFLFQDLRKFLAGWRFNSRSSLTSSIFQCLSHILKFKWAFLQQAERLWKCSRGMKSGLKTCNTSVSFAVRRTHSTSSFFTQNWCTLIFLDSSILLLTGGDQDTALKHVSAMDRVSRIMRFYDNSSWAWQEIFVKWVLHAWIYSVSVQAVMTILFCW